jgi:3-dehydroquinate synthase
LPTRIDGVAPEAALDHMRIDKKVKAGRMRLILLRGIGDSFVTADYSEPALLRTLDAHFSAAAMSG